MTNDETISLLIANAHELGWQVYPPRGAKVTKQVPDLCASCRPRAKEAV